MPSVHLKFFAILQLLQVELVLTGQTAYKGVVSCFPSHISTNQKIPHSYKHCLVWRFSLCSSRGPSSPSFGWAWLNTLPENERLLVGAVWVRVQSTSRYGVAGSSRSPRDGEAPSVFLLHRGEEESSEPVQSVVPRGELDHRHAFPVHKV